MFMGNVIFMSSLALKLFIRHLLLFLISSIHRFMKISLLRLGSGNFDVSIVLFRGVGVRNTCGLRAIWIRCPRMCMWNNICPIGHELMHELISTAFLGSLVSISHIHSLVFFVIIVNDTSFLLASLVVFCEIRTERHKFRVQSGPIVHTCKSLQTVSQNCNAHIVKEYLVYEIWHKKFCAQGRHWMCKKKYWTEKQKKPINFIGNKKASSYPISSPIGRPTATKCCSWGAANFEGENNCNWLIQQPSCCCTYSCSWFIQQPSCELML